MKVLIIEDDRFTREVFKLFMKILGADVDTVDSSKKALENISAKIPDLILLDLLVPNENSLEFIKHCQLNFPSIRIFLMSAIQLNQLIKIAHNAGVEYLSKPIDPPLLAQALFRCQKRAV